MARQPKYNFGLLETPVEVTTDDRSSAASSAGHLASVSSTSSADSHNRARSVEPRARCSRQQSADGRASSVRPLLRAPPTSTSRKTPFLSSCGTPAYDSSSVILALVEGRGLAKGEVGMASIDLKQPDLVLSQFADTQTYAKLMTRLHVLQPMEIVMPSTAYDSGNTSKLLSQVTIEFPNTHVTTVNRKYFSEEKGMQYIKNLCLPEYSTVEITVKSKYYCLATVNALLKYVEFIQNIMYAPSSLKVLFKGSEQTTMIDVSTVINLELLRNIRGSNNQHTMYSVLNSTKTRMGARLLRANILQPPCDVETINMRLDVVEELTGNEELFLSVQSVLSRFSDTDHLLSMCIQIAKEETMKTADNKINTVIHLKHTVELSDALRQALALCKSDNTLLKHYHTMLCDSRFGTIADMIAHKVHDDTRHAKGTLNMRTQKCFAVKPGISGHLDVARRTYTELIDDINDLVQQTADNCGLPLKTSFTSLRGFYIQLSSTGKDGLTVDGLPDQFIKITKTKNLFSFTTEELIKLNDRVKESVNEIYMMSSSVISDLLSDIRQHMGCLYQLTDCVATLDMLVALAHNRTVSNNYTRPEFTDTLAIKNGRHPVLDKVLLEPPVPNNTFASDESNFVIITGPNMSGKSTYLRQIALFQIMAQIGSYVPAEYASFRIVDQIFSRIGSDDEIETNSSTFTVEMRDVSYIIQNATDSSLIVIDELGRGTSIDEGYAICHAVCERIQSLKALTFFATHFLDLTSLAMLYPNVENYHFEVKHVLSGDGRCDKIHYTHVMSRGRTQEKHYGLRLAEVSVLPREIIEDARSISYYLSEQRKKCVEMSAESIHQRAVFKLAKQLEQAAVHSRLDPDSLRAYVKRLKEQFLRDGGSLKTSSASSSELEE